MPFVPDNQPSAQPAAPPWGSVIQDALYKGAAGLPDMVLNAPNRLTNIAKAIFGTAAGASGHPEAMPETAPDPDIVRGALEHLGLIKNVKPQGFAQHATSTLLEGATAGALTGGSSLPGTAAGAGMGALSAGASEAVGNITKSPIAGLAAGLLMPAAAGKAVGGRANVPENVKLLDKEGVLMTPGQILGGIPQRVEDAMTSMPVTGDFIKNAQRRGHETFNMAATNRALEPVGETVQPGTAAGRPAVSYTQDRLGQLYDDLLAKTKGSLDGPAPPTNALPPPGGTAPASTAPSLRHEIENIRQMAQNGNLAPEQKRQISDIIDNEVISRFSPNGGLAPGETLKEIESQLGNLHSTFARSDNYDVRRMAGAVKETQAALRRMIERENPQNAGELGKINEGYANFKRVQDAAGRAYSTDGLFTPSTLQSAVRSGDKSKDKSKFTRGEALMEDLSEAGKGVMTKTVPDSGTPIRHLVTHPDDLLNPKSWLTLATAPAYSEIGQRIAQRILVSPERPSIKNAERASVVPLAEQTDERGKPTMKGVGRFVPDKPIREQLDALKPTEAEATTPRAPRAPEERVVGQVYDTPKGKLKWTAGGWTEP